MTNKNDEIVPFTRDEKKNIAVYILGIMCFKFAFESLGTSISLIAQDRFPSSNALTMSIVLTSTYQVTQCLLAITGAQLLTKFRTSRILATAIFSFGILALILVIIDASTGGSFHKGKEHDLTKYGNWAPGLLFVFYLPMGGCLGIIELIRRVLPRDIVGENPHKLKRMDATVHIFYEVAGTAGAFASTPIIKQAGPAYALISLPVLFTFAAIFWFQIKQNPNVVTDKQRAAEATHTRSVFYLWFYSVKRGAQIVFTERRFIWLMFGYVLPFIFHRFIENNIFPIFAKQVLKEGSLSGILLAGSNLGELIGAFFVLLFTVRVPTPLPWVRFDAIALMTLWVFPFLSFDKANPTKFVWSIFPLMVILSFGWAAGDVSLVAYIQSRIHSVNKHSLDEGTSPLGCVMAFLYSSYILFFMAISIPLGRVFDDYKSKDKIRDAFVYVSGVMVAIGAVLIFASTFVPKGACAFNPKDDPADLIAVDEEEAAKDGEKGPNVVEAIAM